MNSQRSSRLPGFVCPLFVSILLCSCGGGGSPPPPPPNPAPSISSVSPSTAAAGTAGFTLAINGSNFVSTSTLTWNGAQQNVTFVSSSQLTTTVSATALAAAGTIQLTVSTPSPGGGQASTTFTVSAPTAPVVASVSPSTVTVGGPSFTLTVAGSNFVSASVVQWNGASQPTTYADNAHLTAAIPASAITASNAGNLPVTVATPAPGGGSSNSIPVLVEYPLPSITSLSPSALLIGSAPFSLTVNGNNFASGATVYWNSVARVTQFVSSTQLTASILASDTGVAAGYASVTVQNPSPSAGISNVEKFALESPPPVLSSLTPASAPAGPSLWITVNGSGFLPGATAQLGGKSLLTGYNSSTSLGAYIVTGPVGNFSLTVLNPAPTSGVSNALVFDSTASGPGGHFVVASVDPTGTIVDGGDPSFSSTGRYYAFGSYLRDTCLSVSSSCVPSTIIYRPQPDPNFYRVLAGGISPDGRYISSQLTNSGGSLRSGDLELSDSCLNAPAGCVPTTNTLLPGPLFLGTPISSDGRYILYGAGTLIPDCQICVPPPLLVLDTCTGAPPGCPQTSIQVASSASSWSMGADSRFIAYSNGTTLTSSQTITLHDSCLGAAPGCAPTDVAMSNSSLNCFLPYLSLEDLYLSYACGNSGLGDLYLQNTCVNVSSGCTSTPQHLALPEAVNVAHTAVNVGGRFVFFEARGSNSNSLQLVYVYDSCNGVSSGCTARTATVSLASDGALPVADCYIVGISGDGQYIAIYTMATNLATLPQYVSVATYVWKNPLF